MLVVSDLLISSPSLSVSLNYWWATGSSSNTIFRNDPDSQNAPGAASAAAYLEFCKSSG
jgi:hypothetical protein